MSQFETIQKQTYPDFVSDILGQARRLLVFAGDGTGENYTRAKALSDAIRLYELHEYPLRVVSPAPLMGFEELRNARKLFDQEPDPETECGSSNSPTFSPVPAEPPAEPNEPEGPLPSAP